MYRIAQSHVQKPILAFFLQEHHLTKAKAKEINAYQTANNHSLLHVQAHRLPNRGKGGAAIVIPLDMIERAPGESKEAAIRRVRASADPSADGRVIAVKTLVNGTELTLTSIYAPVEADQRPAFYNRVGPTLSKTHLIGMDGNCVFNPALDVSRPGGLTKPEDSAGTAELRSALDNNDLTDTAREALGDASYFTNTTVLQGGTDTTRKRIDYILTPNVDAMTWKFILDPPDILPYQTYGHTMQEIQLDIIKEKRGRDLPFISEAIFDDPDFNTTVVTKIQDIIRQRNPQVGEWGDAWEEAKVAIRDMCLSQSDLHRRRKDEEAARLRGLIVIAKAHAQASPAAANATLVAKVRDLEAQLKEYTTKRRSLHDMLEKEALNNGQRHDVNTAAFHRQWTPKNSAQWVSELIVRDWSDPSNPQPLPGTPDEETSHNRIAEAFTKYYTPLYAEQPPKRMGHDHDGNQIDPYQEAIDTLKSGNRVLKPTAAKCGLPITEQEVAHTLAYLPKGKSPGPDRIPNQFYRVFSSVVGPILTKVYNESREIHGCLPDTLRKGIISVLYKKKDRDDPRNYRPITLLNNDYKIMMRILTARMNEAVVQFVSRDQNGFVPDGFIAENIMRLQLIQQLIEEENSEALFVFLDMEKAFDKCSW